MEIITEQILYVKLVFKEQLPKIKFTKRAVPSFDCGMFRDTFSKWL